MSTHGKIKQFCTKTSVGEHSLEYCTVMLDALNKRRNANVLIYVHKNDASITKNLHVIARQGTKIGGDNAHIEKMQRK